MTRFQKWIVILLVIPILVGCTSFGAKSIERDKADYTDAIAESMKVQMLQNIVKMRFGDMPLFLDVKSVIKSYTLEYELDGGVNVYPSFSADAGVSGTYADKPTISYAPLVGKAFAESMMKPVSPAFLVQLLQSGASAETAFGLLCDEINGKSNRRARGGNIRPAEPEFERVIRLLNKIQTSGYLDLQVRTSDEEIILMITQKDSSGAIADVQELKRLLGLPADRESFRIIYGMLPGEPGEIAILTRSLYSVLVDLAADMEVSPGSVEEGRAKPGYNPPGAVISIKTGRGQPDDAFVAIPYKNQWYWIEDTDLASKMVFSNLLTLFTMAGSGLDQVAPVLTIPAG